MTFKYSICYPNNEEIEYRNNPISAAEVIAIARDYPWLEQMALLEQMDQNDVQYSPSIDFSCIENGNSISLTCACAEGSQESLEFGLWHNRPKKVRILFGLFGEYTKMCVDESSLQDFETSLKYLGYFVNGLYDEVEKLYIE